MAVEEWDRRQLCSDGACTGVIGATGVCNTCGRAAPNWGDERKRGLRNPTDAPPIVKDDDDIAPSAPAALGAMADWGTRRLCSDGGCIGVIGPNNKCKVCGKPGPAKTKPAATGGDADLARIAAEMAGTATAGDLASIDAPADDEYEADDEDASGDGVEYEDDDEDDESDDEDDESDDEDDEDDESDDGASADAEHDHGDENDAEPTGDDEGDDGESDDDGEDDDDDDNDDNDDEDEEEEEGEDEDEDEDEGGDTGAISASSGERQLCADGACVGVIGANGRCKICDKPGDWTEESA